MKRVIIAALAVLVATVAVATTTWTTIRTPGYVRGVKGSNPTVSGTDPAPVTSTASTDGLDLMGLGGVAVYVETVSGGNMTAGGQLLAHIWNPATGKWHRAPDLDLIVQALPAQAFPGLTVPGDYGRIAWEPNGLGTSTYVYQYGTGRLLLPR